MEERRVLVRVFDEDKDVARVEELERRCEVGPPGKISLFTNLLGDPLCRVRHSSPYLMLVAEKVQEKEIVGLIRGCIKTVTCGKKLRAHGAPNSQDPSELTPLRTKIGYILGLRVSPSHRKRGIGSKLVREMEDWFTRNGAVYSYLATESGNKPSLSLFIDKCHYSEFRTPSILVHPVFAHRVKTHHGVNIIKLNPRDAETLYRRRFSTTEFFPSDIDRILHNRLNLGTFIAVPAGSSSGQSWPGSDEFLTHPPESWAVLSIWNCKEAFTLEVRGASLARRLAADATRLVDRAFPWLRIPSFPDVFRPFGVHFLYGLGGEGPRAGRMMTALCGHAHNVAKEMGCAVVVAEVATGDPLKLAIPHWKRLWSAEDVWCIKRLVEDYSEGPVGDWTKSPSGPSIFVDPREV